jgi:hypothetical protein
MVSIAYKARLAMVFVPSRVLNVYSRIWMELTPLELTRIDKKTVTNLIEQAREQAGVVIAKPSPAYTIQEWGPVIKKPGQKCA